MRPRDYIIENAADLGTAGTHTIDLDFTDPMTALVLRFSGTNGATSNVGAPLDRLVSKIEIVDGGTVLFDSPGDVVLGHYVNMRGTLPDAYRDESADAVQYQEIVVPFGRHLYDTRYSFNPVAHRNPQLRVTFDEATVRAAGATGYVSDSITLTTIARIMERGDNPVGFLTLKEVESFTTAASGDQRIIMPTDRVLRSLLVRAYEAGIGVPSTLTNLELSCDGRQFVPFDISTALFRNMFAAQLPVVDYGFTAYMTDDTAHEVWLDYLQAVSAVTATDGQLVSVTSFGNGQVTPSLFDDTGAAVAADTVKLTVQGYGFNSLYPYLFGDKDNPDTWFDITQFNRADLFLTQGNAGGEVNVSLEQVYRY